MTAEEIILKLKINELEKNYAALQQKYDALVARGKQSLLTEYFEGFKAANRRFELILEKAKKNGGLIDVKTIEQYLIMDAALLPAVTADGK